MPENTSTPAVATAAPEPYKVKVRELPFADGYNRFITKQVFTTSKAVVDGKTVTQKVAEDYLIPDTSAATPNEAIDRKVGFIAAVMKKQEAKEAGAGVGWLDKQIDRLADGPNEVLFDDNGNENKKAYVEAYETPAHRSGVSENKVLAEIKAEHQKLGELYTIVFEKNPQAQAEKMAAAGFQDKGSITAKMDSIGQRITKLSKTLADVKARKLEKQAAKNAKEAADKARAATIAGATAQPAKAA